MPVQNLRYPLVGDAESFGQFFLRLPFGILCAYLTIAVMLGWGVICKGELWCFLPNVREQQPVADRLCKVLQSPGLDPPMGHRLPHAFRADGSFVFTLENAVSHLVSQLYRGLSLPTSPQSQATPKQVERNALACPKPDLSGFQRI